MSNISNRRTNKKGRKNRGQAIVEYSACIAFVCVMIALAFRIANGTLFGAISGAYSNVNGTLQLLNKTVADHG
jgi:Flp pilus assembly pilin Flp